MTVPELDSWFKANTHHHSEYADIDALVRSKESQGLKVSVCLPTMNVVETVGECLRVIREELVERHSLIDQLCVIDSRSGDGTIEAARAEGAQVFFDDEILTGVEPASGKGEALWKSLFALEGDIIVWVDSDIENMHPRFVYGLVGPLLAQPEVGYVKAFYERPLKEGAELRPSGGGRVTELTVRPMFNLFYPELAGLVQPLSGEYAGRRSVLESVPFFTGYGVEAGLLLDILDSYGQGAIAQTDVEVRIHHNQQIPALSKMSFGIMQTLFKRLETDGKVELQVDLPSVYNTIRHEGTSYSLEQVEVKIVERPPIATIPEYRAARGLGA